MHRAVFLDRDGVINVDRGYVGRSEDFVFLPGVAEALARLRRRGFLLVLVTNQSGIARGLFSEADFWALTAYMQDCLQPSNAQFDRIYHCPHLRGAPIARYSVECECRKPRPGMLLQAIRELDIDPGASFMVGDRPRDLEAGQAAGLGQLIGVGPAVAEWCGSCDKALACASLHDFVLSYDFGDGHE